MNWTAQDEAKWAELDARRNAKLKRDEIRLCGIADWISIHLESAPKSLYNLMVMRAKELRDALEPYDDRATKQECSQSNQADDGWIEWNGGEQPIPNGSIADVKYRDGTIQHSMVIPDGEESFKYRASIWKHTVCGSDIIAYRPIK